MMISEEQIQQFLQGGCVAVDGFLSARAAHDMVREVGLLEPDEQASRVRRGVAFARRNLLELDFVRALIGLPSVRELLDVLAPGAVAVRAILFDKSGSANWTVPWHQDRSIAVRERIDVPGFGPWSKKAGIVHVQPPLEILLRMLTLRIHLDPCGEDNGPLRAIAGTHHRIFNQTEIENALTALPQITCSTGAGGLLIMRPLVLHASSPAAEPSHCRVIHIEFGPASLPGGLRWAAAFVRGLNLERELHTLLAPAS